MWIDRFCNWNHHLLKVTILGCGFFISYVWIFIYSLFMPLHECVLFFWKRSNWWVVHYSKLGFFNTGNWNHLRQKTRRCETVGDHFVKGVQTAFHSISRPVATRGSSPIELSGRVTRLNRTIKAFPEEKQAISCHQFRCVSNPISMWKVLPPNML